jgi:hypothetical protein
MAMEGKPLPERQRSYLDTILTRLRASDFELSQGVLAVQSPEYGYLPAEYLWMGKCLKYSPLSIIGFVEEVVLIGSFARMDLDTMATFARRALADALARRSYFKYVFPVVTIRVFPVILADEVATGLTEHFRDNGPPMALDTKALLYPVVVNSTAGKFDYYRKVAMFGSMEVQACQARAESLFAV